ncbi:hypothetical protein [Terrimonas alba]|uniref:hypothetical protein n=1 Tax=Terrimonas alba TaxID=3349636 RepID=UPI0035F24733
MANTLRNCTIILICIASNLYLAKAQSIEANLELYANKYSPERIYIHYDKSAYSVGETIWFKVYMINEVVPADESKTLYIDWIDDKGNLVLHAVNPMVEGITAGQFEIPADYKGKSIHVRAYTKWMLNFDSAFLYNKEIPVLTRESTQADVKNKIIPTIRFFPEGGDIIAGIPNKIAFKANDQWGRPLKIKGTVINSQGKTQDNISTIHDGMGYFFLTPESGLTYTAKWKDEKGVEHNTELPKIKSDGATLQVEISGINRIFSVACSPGMISTMDSVYLVGTIYQHPAFKVARATGSGPIKGTIPTSGLPSGILTITLFDKNWKPLAERITYINNKEYSFQPEMEVQRWGLNKRARNEIKISVPDSLIANLSVSVTDAGIGTDSSSNIISHLMLSSELKGQVYNPAYYFSNNSDSASQHLDLVMLTHGWRRFKWDDIVSGKINPPLYAKDTSYITLSGKVLGVLPGQINRDAAVVLMVKQKDKAGQMILVPVESNGTFNDPATIIFDTAQVYYSFQKAKELKDASIQFMTERLPAPFLNPSNFYKPYGLAPDTTGNYRQFMLANEANSLAEMMKIKTLENVTVKSKGKSPTQLLDEKYSSGMFSGGDSYQFDLVNDPFASSALNIFTYLQGKVAGLQINTSGANPSMQWRGGSPQLYLDETAVDPSFVTSLNVSDVAYIKVFRPPFMGGFNGANGAIAIYTRRGGDVKPEPGKGLNSNKVFGYTLIKEFYSPNYAAFTQKNEQRDLRTTLYWNPSVITVPQKNQVVLSFYNNDVTGAFRVIIEGMTRDGKLAHIEQMME